MDFEMRLLQILMALGIFFLPGSSLFAQGKLDKHISMKISQKPLKQVLTEIGRKGDFYFSYNTTILKGDSLVSLSEENSTIRQILDKLLGGNYEYVESGRYVILLQKAAPPPARTYTLSGYVVDGTTKEKINEASVYESTQLVSTLTDTNGFFRLKLKDRNPHVVLVVSKQLYRDTLLLVEAGHDQQFTFNIEQDRITELSPFVVSHRPVEKTWLGRWFLSSKEIVQSMNLIGFFANKPIQFSLTPGLGTHGQMGAQVINKFSLNVVGGYTAGINGFEMAGVFNIDKKEVRYVQLAGAFNTVGGKVEGVQLAGVYNHDLDSLSGFQAAGMGNIVNGGMKGVQLAGVFNRVEKEVGGVQAAGVYNQNLGRTKGVQLAGVLNISKGTMNGVQMSSVLNYTRNLKGVQIGLINIADTSSGYMIGLVNIVKNGYHKLTVSANELLPVNLAYKTGSPHLYSILLAGWSSDPHEKAYSAGLGIGNEMTVSRQLAWVNEFSLSHFFLGNRDGTPMLYRLQSCLQLAVTKKISLFAGPAFSIYHADHVQPSAGYKTMPGTTSFGWVAGVNFF